jgi:Aminoglycoside/hydroxyurea antibiotic resistance kinase
MLRELYGFCPQWWRTGTISPGNLSVGFGSAGEREGVHRPLSGLPPTLRYGGMGRTTLGLLSCRAEGFLRYRRWMGSTVLRPDEGARQRLIARFGVEVEAWFDDLPDVLVALAEQWQFEFGAPIPRGSVSVVFRCQMADGRSAVLKASPDRTRLAYEAAALDRWQAPHTPAVLAIDQQVGALLIEAIEPGTPLVVSSTYPELEAVAELLNSLHVSRRS